MCFRLNKKLIILALLGILVIVLTNIYQNRVRNFFYSISAPVQKKLWGAKIEQQNVKFEAQIQELLSKTARLFELEEENKVLREALGIGLHKKFKLVFGQVTGKNIAEDSLLINVGVKDGLKKNFPVITEQKALVGKIDEVFENFSRVQLISNKKSSFEGRLLGRELQGLVRGAGNSKLTFDLVPQSEEVKEGEIVITTALGGIFPSDLLVGIVKSVKKSDVEPFQQIEIQPAFDLEKIDYLFIITN